MNNLLKILDYTEKNRILYFLFCPIFYLIEWICFLFYWEKIKQEILTSEDIVNFLDENEFGYKWNSLYKIDIIEPDSFLEQFSLDEMAVKIKLEFTKELTNKIAKNTAFDVENYINLLIKTEIIPKIKIKKYSVYIRYYRYHLIISNIKYLLLWNIIFFIIFYLVLSFYK